MRWRFTGSRRAALLLIFGVMFILIGLTYLGQAEEITAARVSSQAYRAHLALMPLDVWAWLFIICGVTATISGIRGHDTLGFCALMAIASWWGLEFLASWVVTGYDRAILGALLYLGLTSALLVIVGWPDPPRLRVAEALPWAPGE